MLLSRFIPFLLVLLVAAACRRGEAEPPANRELTSTRVTGAGARLVLLDSVRLSETDSSTIGDVSAFAVDDSGEIFVADGFSARVLEFSPDGHFVRAFGRKGRGPGELELPFSLVLLGDTLLAVGNRGANSPVLFDRRSGAWVTSGHAAGYVKSGRIVGDALWLGVVSRSRNASLAAWHPGADSMRYFGPVPAEYTASARLWSMMPQAPFVTWGDTVALGFAGVNRLYLLDSAGAVLDSIEPPVARRRGVPADLVAQYASIGGVEQLTQLSSILMQVGRLPSGEIVLVHHDVTHHGDQFTPTAYVTLLSADRTRACVDAVLPLSPAAKGATALVADRIVAFEQATTRSDAASTVRSYRIDGSGCEWVAMR